MPAGEAQGGMSPAQRLPALPAAFGGQGSPGITRGICSLPLCFAQATAWSWEGGRGCACSAWCLRSGLTMLSARSPGAVWLCAACLEGFLRPDPAAVPWGWGTWPRWCRKAVAEQGHEGSPRLRLAPSTGWGRAVGEVGRTRAPQGALCLAVCFLKWV